MCLVKNCYCSCFYAFTMRQCRQMYSVFSLSPCPCIHSFILPFIQSVSCSEGIYVGAGASAIYIILTVDNWVTRWRNGQSVVLAINRSWSTRGKSCVTTLGKLYSPMCLCYRAIQLYGWEGNRKPGGK